MEYLIVHFPESRRVLIDGSDRGRTDETLELERGTYLVTLSPPVDYKPVQRKVALKRTSPVSPLEIRFAKAKE
jgi:PEGA domain